MEKQIKIQSYSCYDNYTVKDRGENWSRIASKMVQLAGRYCESYASDVYYDIDAFVRHIDDKINYDKYLFFHENGVTTFSPEYLKFAESTDFIQIWHLTYNAKTEEQEFARVSVYFGKEVMI